MTFVCDKCGNTREGEPAATRAYHTTHKFKKESISGDFTLRGVLKHTMQVCEECKAIEDKQAMPYIAAFLISLAFSIGLWIFVGWQACLVSGLTVSLITGGIAATMALRFENQMLKKKAEDAYRDKLKLGDEKVKVLAKLESRHKVVGEIINIEDYEPPAPPPPVTEKKEPAPKPAATPVVKKEPVSTIRSIKRIYLMTAGPSALNKEQHQDYAEEGMRLLMSSDERFSQLFSRSSIDQPMVEEGSVPAPAGTSKIILDSTFQEWVRRKGGKIVDWDKNSFIRLIRNGIHVMEYFEMEPEKTASPTPATSEPVRVQVPPPPSSVTQQDVDDLAEKAGEEDKDAVEKLIDIIKDETVDVEVRRSAFSKLEGLYYSASESFAAWADQRVMDRGAKRP